LSIGGDGEVEPDNAQLQSTLIHNQPTDNLVPSATVHICNNDTLNATADVIGTLLIRLLLNETVIN